MLALFNILIFHYTMVRLIFSYNKNTADMCGFFVALLALIRIPNSGPLFEGKHSRKNGWNKPLGSPSILKA